MLHETSAVWAQHRLSFEANFCEAYGPKADGTTGRPVENGNLTKANVDFMGSINDSK